MKQYATRTLEQAATVALETAVQDAIGALRDGFESTEIRRFDGTLIRELTVSRGTDNARGILLAAAVTAESLLGRTDG